MGSSAGNHPYFHGLTQEVVASSEGGLLPNDVREVVRTREPLATTVWMLIGGLLLFAVLEQTAAWLIPSFIGPVQGVSQAIALESSFLAAAVIGIIFLPSAIVHNISLKTTLEGLKLDWPELVYATLTLISVLVLIGSMIVPLSVIGWALSIGFVEEMLFRVVLLGWLVTRVSTPSALAISAVAFGFAHLHGFSLDELASVIPQTAGGFILGAVYLRTRNPLGPVLGHAYWDIPYLTMEASGISYGAGVSSASATQQIVSVLPWVLFAVYALWLIRNGVQLVGREGPIVS